MLFSQVAAYGSSSIAKILNFRIPLPLEFLQGFGSRCVKAWVEEKDESLSEGVHSKSDS